jgi:hypothetical protein
MSGMVSPSSPHRPLPVLIASVIAYIALDVAIIAAAMLLPPILAFLRRTD